MLDLHAILALLLATGISGATLVGASHLLSTRWGRRALLVGVALIPLSASALSLRSGIKESSRTRFCVSCHEMKDHGRSLFVEDRKVLPAVHFQNRLIDRDTACFSCHTDYALFGDLKAKWNGLRHVWVHYLGTVQDKIQLYQPYPNYNCLHCHDDARRFLEAAPHRPVLTQMRSGALSCLGCHAAGHDLAAVKAGRLWQAE